MSVSGMSDGESGVPHPTLLAVSATKSWCDPTWIGIKRDLPDDELVPLNADLDQNSGPEVAQRGGHLDA
jgi:hypothetical protein